MDAYDIKTGNPVPRQKSPLEEDVWLMPGGCTDVEPPTFNAETQTCQFDGSQWVVAEIPEEEEEQEPFVPSTYVEKRVLEYGSVLSQLEFITENGLEAWQTKVAEIKKKYPKE